MSRYADVIVDLSADRVDQSFTYRIPEGMSLSEGQRAVVPFGPRRVEAFVVGLRDDCGDVPPERVKDIVRPIEDYPVLLPDMIELAGWMRAKYDCTLTAALRLMIPAQLRGERIHEKRVNVAALCVDEAAAHSEIEKRARFPRQAEILTLLLEGPKPTPFLTGLSGGAASALKALKKQGLVAIESEERRRSPFRSETTRGQTDPVLTVQQQAVVNRVTQAMRSGGGRFLLMGVTGSGKTEVYIRLIRQALSEGKGAIVLAPEIALTPQMVDWFRSRFGEGAAVLHSRLSAGERYDEWRRIRRGEARVVVGARSAVFAPVERLGIIVVDEEHEHTYQSDKRPRYDAREVARYRCERENAPLILGSATPSIASYMRCMPGVRPENKYELLELNQRVFGRPMPQVEIVDMCRELEKGNHSIFSAALQEELTACLEKGDQAMLLINRRGYSTFVSCRACGYVEKCEACDVSMTYHQTENLLRCHYCDAVRKPPEKCPKCGSSFIRFFGTGTQKVEEAVKKLLSQARVARMDVDTTRAKDAHEKILSSFRRREIDVLIGTQMIAKGLDFPAVTLVGVVAADMTLNLPDYRSPERTFQLITQVAGRAGRSNLPGKVLVQTYTPDHYAIRFAAAQDYRAFYHEEVKQRRYGLYPPFTVMARILVNAKESADAERAAKALEVSVNEFLNEREDRKKFVIQMRALEAPITKLRGEARWQVFIKLYAKEQAEEILKEMERLSRIEIRNVRTEFEINPANMF